MRIHHVAFRTHALSRLHAFYTGLGFATTRTDDRAAWLAAGEAILMLERADVGEVCERAESKDVIAFVVTKVERTEIERALLDAGIPLDGRTAYTTYVRDPDGRRVAFSHYPEA